MSSEEDFDSFLLDDVDAFLDKRDDNDVDTDINVSASASPLRKDERAPATREEQEKEKGGMLTSLVVEPLGTSEEVNNFSSKDVSGDGVLLESSGALDSSADSINIETSSSSSSSQSATSTTATSTTRDANVVSGNALSKSSLSPLQAGEATKDAFESGLVAARPSKQDDLAATSVTAAQRVREHGCTAAGDSATEEMYILEDDSASSKSVARTPSSSSALPHDSQASESESDAEAPSSHDEDSAPCSMHGERIRLQTECPSTFEAAGAPHVVSTPPPLQLLPDTTDSNAAAPDARNENNLLGVEEKESEIDPSLPRSADSLSASTEDTVFKSEERPHAGEAPVLVEQAAELEKVLPTIPTLHTSTSVPQLLAQAAHLIPPLPFTPTHSHTTTSVATEEEDDDREEGEENAKTEEDLLITAPAVIEDVTAPPPVFDFKEIEQEAAPTAISEHATHAPETTAAPSTPPEDLEEPVAAVPLLPSPSAPAPAPASPPCGAKHAPSSPPPQRRGNERAADAASKVACPPSALQAEDDLLDALLAAMDDPQADSSGAAAGADGVVRAADAVESSGAHLIHAVIEQAEVLATSSVICSSKRKGECVLHFHQSSALKRELETLGGFEGWPTCAAVASHVSLTRTGDAGPETKKRVSVVVGTTLGVVAVFDQTFRVMGKCGSAGDADGAQMWGAVHSLSLADNSETLLAGYERHVLVLWSTTQLTAIRTVRDEFDARIEKVLHLPLEPYKALTMEANGSVKLLRFTRIVNKAVVRISNVVEAAAGSATKDIAVCPFPSLQYEHGRDHAAAPGATGGGGGGGRSATGADAFGFAEGQELVLYAPHVPQARAEDTHLVASIGSDAIELYRVETGLVSKTVCIARRGHTPQPGPASERVAFAFAESPSERQIRLCASIAKRLEIYLLHVNAVEAGAVMAPMFVVELAAPARALCAIAAGCVVALDGVENGVTVLDPAVGEKVERHTLASTVMATPSGHQDLEKLFLGTLVSNLNECFLLGRQDAFSCCLLSWKARLDGLILRKRYQAALRLVEQLHGEAAAAVVGLSESSAVNRQAFQEYVQYICMAFVKSTLAANKSSSPSPSPACYRKLHEALVLIIPFCAKLEMLDVFFLHIVKYLNGENCMNYVLYALEECMLRDALPALPESYAYAFFHFFSDPSALHDVEKHLGPPPCATKSGDTKGTTGDGGGAGSGALTPAPRGGGDGVARAEAALMHLSEGLDALLDFAEKSRLLLLKLSLLSLRRRKVDDALYFILEEAERENKNATEEKNADSGIGGGAKPSSPPRPSAREYTVRFVEKTLQGLTLLENEALPPDLRVPFKRTLWLALGDGTTLARVLACDPPRVVDALLGSMSATGSLWSPFDSNSCPLRCCASYVFDTLTKVPAETRGGSNSKSGGRRLMDFDVAPCLLPTGVAEGAAAEAGEFATTATATSVAGAMGANAGAGHDDTLHFIPRKVAERGSFTYPVVHRFVKGAITLLWSQGEVGVALAGVDWRGFVKVCVDDYLYLCQHASGRDERHTLEVELSQFLVSVPEAVNPSFLRSYADDFSQSGMFRCLATLHCVQGFFGEAIDCFLSKEHTQHDATLAADVFPMLRSEAVLISKLEKRASRREGKEQVKERLSELRRAVVERVPRLVEVDATELAQFVYDFLPSKHKDIMNVLTGSSKVFLQYIEELIAKGDVNVLGDTNLQNRYIELLAVERPAKVYTHLKSNAHLISYDVQVALRTVRACHIADATIFLLGKALSYDEAVREFVQYCHDALRAVRHEVCDLDSVLTSTTNIIPEEQKEKTHAPHAPSLQALDHVVEVGIEFCGAVRPQGDAGKYWFVLLDCFALPRQVVGRWLQQTARTASAAKTSREKGENFASTVGDSDGGDRSAAAADELQEVFRDLQKDPFRTQKVTAPDDRGDGAPLAAVSAAERKKLEQLLAIYTTYTSNIVRELVKVMDPSTVVSKILRDDAEENLEPLKAILVDIMATLRFDLQARRLCMTCAEDDVMQLSKELYAHITRGIAPQSDCCGICRGPLGDPPRRRTRGTDAASSSFAASGTTTTATTAVCAFACGHAYHDACRRLEWVGQDAPCYQCYLRRAGEADSGGVARTIADAAAAAIEAPIPFGDRSNGSGAGSKSSGSGSSAVAVEGPRAPVAVRHRRLRQTRAKLNRSSGSLYDVLKSFLDPAKKEAAAAPGLSFASAKVNLVLAPPPRPSVHIAPSADNAEAPPPLDLTAAESIQHRLTDAEVQELFGL